jgi:hypothetical protein
VPYPPPFHCFAWEKLREPERKIALEELRDITKAEWRERTGDTEENDDIRKEWRSWYRMSGAERKYAFEKMQVCFSFDVTFA